jgi:hypothetical protein
MRSETRTIISAMRILSVEIQSGDGIANAAIAEAANRLEELDAAIRETIEENLHLADGENCTLIKLKRAISY